MSGPTWNDVLRFPAGSLLHAEFTLKPMLRETMETQLSRNAWPFKFPDAATLQVLSLDATSCDLAFRQAALSITLGATLAGEREYVLEFAAVLGDQRYQTRIDRVVLQTSGPREAYLARANDAGRRQFLRLSYDRQGKGVSVSVLTAYFRDRIPEQQRMWLPSELEIARLSPLQDGGP